MKREDCPSGLRFALIVTSLKFGVVYAAGSAPDIIVQLFIFHTFNLLSVLINIFGAVAAYPLNYFTSIL